MEEVQGLNSQISSGKPSVDYTRLIAGMAIVLVVSLSIHVVMLQVVHIPFPEFAGVSSWASYLNTTLAIFSLIVVRRLAQPHLVRFSTVTQCIVIFFVYAMLKESFRGIIMNGVVTTGWGFDIVAGLPGLAYLFVLTCFVVLLFPLLRNVWTTLAGAAAIAATGIFVVRPALGTAFAPALRAAAHLNHEEVHAFPYGWQVLVPAYVTYAEPVIACMLLAYLVWQSLSARPVMRMLQFSTLTLLMRGMLLPTFIYSFYSQAKLSTAMLSQSQFLFESLALAILTAVVWEVSRTHRTDGPSSSQE